MAKTKTPVEKEADKQANRDPLSGAPGAHPVGVGAGAAAGAATGAAVGSLAGPVGTAVGSVVGGVAGGLAGKGIAENIDPTVEDAYWRENYASRPYVEQGSPYDEYRDAYQYGWQAKNRYGELNWDDIEEDMERNWEKNRGQSRLDWPSAKSATRDAYDRVDLASRRDRP
jgi:phage tail tape-measure protein